MLISSQNDMALLEKVSFKCDQYKSLPLFHYVFSLQIRCTCSAHYSTDIAVVFFSKLNTFWVISKCYVFSFSNMYWLVSHTSVILSETPSSSDQIVGGFPAGGPKYRRL